MSETAAAVTVESGPLAGALSSAEIWLPPVARSREVAIGRGENKGRTVIYANVVRALTPVGTWTGAPARFEVPLEVAMADGADAYVVLVQAADQGRPGPILAAAKGPRL